MNAKTTTLHILSLILISWVILIGCKSNKTGNEAARKEIAFHSEPVQKNNAERLREYYLHAPDSILTKVDANETTTNQVKFTFKAADIKKILNRIDTTSGTKDKVDFVFGLDYLGGNGEHVWHLIAYGMTVPFIAKFPGGKLLDTPDPKTGQYTIFYNIDDPYNSTGRINIDASTSYSNYQKDANSIVTLDKAGRKIFLYAFSFNADQIQEIIYSNSSTGIPDQVVIYLGLEPVTGSKIDRWHVVAYGSKKGINGAPDELLDGSAKPSTISSLQSITSVTFKRPSIFDKADPCPPCN